MLTKKAFNQLKKGDFLITKSRIRPPKLREVLTDSRNNAVRLKGVYYSFTVYTYWDLYKKVLGVWKIKSNIIMSKRATKKHRVISEVLVEIFNERKKQDEKWGEQNHPCLDKVLLERKGGCTPTRMTQNYDIPTESSAKYSCDLKSKRGDVTWTDIALEEFCEVVSEFNPEKRRQELVQLGAVVVAWIEKIDRDLSK